MPSFKFPISWGLTTLLTLSIVLLIAIVPFDYEWTIWLYENRWPRFAEFMRRTLFEGGSFGGSDVAITFQLVAFFAYFYVGSPKREANWQKWRPMLGYVLVCALVTGLGTVHSLKWLVGRARPHIVMKNELPFSNWFEFGPHFVSDGVFFGSFPSGHTAVVFLLMAISYLLAGYKHSPTHYKIIGWGWGVFVTGYTLLMVIARSMTRHHWLSDSLATIAMAWILMHLLYFWILGVPTQLDYWNHYKKFPSLPKYWELVLCLYALGITLGAMGIVIGIRAVLLQKAPWLIVLALPGSGMVYYWTKRGLAFYRRILKSFQSPP